MSTFPPVEASPTPVKTRPVRIVVVDDHQMLRDGLRSLLAREAPGLELVGEAGSAYAGHALVSRLRPDLVVLDLNLPDQNGANLATAISTTWPETKVLVLSGSCTPPEIRNVMRSGAHGFVHKEDAASELLRAIPLVMAGQPCFSPGAASAIAQALWRESEPKPRSETPPLSGREREFLRSLAGGLGYKEIADQMSVSVRTVETYRARLVRKLGCATRAGLIRYAVRNGMADTQI